MQVVRNMRTQGFKGQVDRAGIGGIKIKGKTFGYGKFIQMKEFEKYWPYKPTAEIDL